MAPVSALTDRLAEALDDSFPELVIAMQDGIYSGALRILGDPHDAEDITQETFVRAYRALRKMPTTQRRALELRPWLWTIAINRCRSHLRERARHPAGADATPDRPSRDAGPEDRALSRDAEQRWARALHTLSPPMRTAVVLRHVVGMSYDEIATALHRPAGTVKADVHRGIRRLRTLVTEGS